VKTVADVVGMLYQELLSICEQRGISLGLDIQHPSVQIPDKELQSVYDFLQSQIERALQDCDDGDKIVVSETMTDSDIVLAIKNCGRALESSVRDALKKKGYDVRARYGYDTNVSLKIPY
jgi:UV DNA damage repair endonuclease